jgi:hypothetical protein
MSCSEQQYNSTDSGQQCAQQRHSTTHSEMPHTTAAAAAQRMAAQTRLLRMRRGLAHELHALGARGTLSSLQTRNETRISRPVAAETVQVFTGCVFADRKILRNAFLHSPAAAVRIVPCTRNTLVHTRVGHKCGKLARDRSVKCACARACPACACLRAASCCIPSFCCMYVSSPIMYFSDDSPGPAAGGGPDGESSGQRILDPPNRPMDGVLPPFGRRRRALRALLLRPQGGSRWAVANACMLWEKAENSYEVSDQQNSASLARFLSFAHFFACVCAVFSLHISP